MTQTPPDMLYHGTSSENATSILVEGLKPGADDHVHLSSDPAKAREAAAHLVKPVVFSVYAGAAFSEGQSFSSAADDLWLTESVHPDFLYLPHVRGAE
ncbi:RNA 2'-phosphotransferase [Actibacterium pelagium]|uniref:RNA 2'-phosphotransferase n=1 Tax=Actibacterium pelagium TaxID=2029103 RepID=A0A917EKT7_9RHOB|nr:RNA 2'-phosphotransferase [Actibacterium pelagium]GGE49076.1 hypothetical protein GCM10011517_16200 [Actibacterium pelagium]